jgi:hypothetical protein
MDPVERALRVGGEREAAKKSEEDAGTLAGEDFSNAWRRIPLLRVGALQAETRQSG